MQGSPVQHSGHRFLLLASVATIATCGLIYELVAGALASYLLGDSVTQFSTVIGAYLFAMGIGSWISKWIHGDLLAAFIRIEFLIGVIGGFSALILFTLFDRVSSFRLVLYGLVFLTGILVGLEIPLLLRLLKDQLKFEDLVSRVLSLDYIGALAASILFPILLVPHLGLIRTSFLFGWMNAAVGIVALIVLRRQIRRIVPLWISGICSITLLSAGLAFSDKLESWSERAAYADPVVFATSTSFQRIVLTRKRDEVRLYLNGNLQFSTRDEYRYHESLVHPALSRHPSPRHVLILGGGDGLAAREILRDPTVDSVRLVDLDPGMTQLFSRHPLLRPLHHDSLTSPRLRITHRDAFTWLDDAIRQDLHFDVVIVDFPDPSNFSLGKLYSTSFYQRLKKVLEPRSIVAIQSTSPLAARTSFWCVDETLRACGFSTAPYHAYVPSFGEWGFILASPEPVPPELLRPLPSGLRYLTPELDRLAFEFPPDMSRVPAGVNRLNNQLLVRHFEREWARYE